MRVVEEDKAAERARGVVEEMVGKMVNLLPFSVRGDGLMSYSSDTIDQHIPSG